MQNRQDQSNHQGSTEKQSRGGNRASGQRNSSAGRPLPPYIDYIRYNQSSEDQAPNERAGNNPGRQSHAAATNHHYHAAHKFNHHNHSHKDQIDESMLSKFDFRYEPPTCSICMQEMTTGLAVTKCGHVFHAECLKNCMKVRNQCPECRSLITASSNTRMFFEIKKTRVNGTQLKNLLPGFTGNASDINERAIKRNLALSEQNQTVTKRNDYLQKENKEVHAENGRLKVVLEKLRTKIKGVIKQKEEYELKSAIMEKDLKEVKADAKEKESTIVQLNQKNHNLKRFKEKFTDENDYDCKQLIDLYDSPEVPDDRKLTLFYESAMKYNGQLRATRKNFNTTKQKLDKMYDKEDRDRKEVARMKAELTNKAKRLDELQRLFGKCREELKIFKKKYSDASQALKEARNGGGDVGLGEGSAGFSMTHGFIAHKSSDLKPLGEGGTSEGSSYRKILKFKKKTSDDLKGFDKDWDGNQGGPQSEEKSRNSISEASRSFNNAMSFNNGLGRSGEMAKENKEIAPRKPLFAVSEKPVGPTTLFSSKSGRSRPAFGSSGFGKGLGARKGLGGGKSLWVDKVLDSETSFDANSSTNASKAVNRRMISGQQQKKSDFLLSKKPRKRGLFEPRTKRESSRGRNNKKNPGAGIKTRADLMNFFKK